MIAFQMQVWLCACRSIRHPDSGTRLLQFRQFNRVFTRLAYATVERARRDNRPWHVAIIAIDGNDMGHLARTVLAERSSAKDAYAMRRSFTVPAVHTNLPPVNVDGAFSPSIVLNDGLVRIAPTAAMW